MAECGNPRLLIADDHRPTRARLARALRRDGFTIVAECPNGLSAIEAAVQATPDVCLLEVHMPGVSGIEATLRIGQQLPIAGVVVMTASPNELGLAEAIRAGAHGYVDKWLETPRLAGTLRVVFSGQTAFPRALVRRALGHELAH